MDAPHPSHDPHEPHEHHEQPEETLAADEAPTPMWLPVLGAALFLLAAMLVFAGG